MVFVPVGLAYDRVPEDKILTATAQSGERRFRVAPLSAIGFALNALLRLGFGRFKGFGTAAAAFGAPISLRQFMQFYAASVQQRLSLACDHNPVTVALAVAGL